MSVELPDWYSKQDSAAFTKETLRFTGKVFVEATELGDVLATGALPFLQGIEAPQENSSDTGLISACGQAATLTFYAELLPHSAPTPAQPLPPGNGAGVPWTAPLTEHEFRHTWSWRRAFCAGMVDTEVPCSPVVIQLNY